MPNSFYSFISRRNKYTAEKQHIQTPHITNVLQLIITCASFRPQLMRLRGISETINLNIVNCDSNGGVRALHHKFIRVLETALLHNNLALEIFCTCDVTLAPLPFTLEPTHTSNPKCIGRWAGEIPIDLMPFSCRVPTVEQKCETSLGERP